MKKGKRTLAIFCSSFTAIAAASIAFLTKTRLKESVPVAGYSHSQLVKKSARTIVEFEPELFQNGIIKATCSAIVYDISDLQFAQTSYLTCDAYMSALTITIPSNVNVVLESQSFLGNCAALTGRYMDTDIPQLYVKARACLSNISIRCADDSL